MSYVCSACTHDAGADPLRCLVCNAIICDDCAGPSQVCQPCREQADRRPDGSLNQTTARIRREARRRERE